MDALPASFRRLTRKNALKVNFEPIAVLKGGVATVDLKFSPPLGCHWTEDAPSAWQVLPNGEFANHIVQHLVRVCRLGQREVHIKRNMVCLGRSLVFESGMAGAKIDIIWTCCGENLCMYMCMQTSWI